MKLSREQMLAGARARDPRFDGQFLTGVVTTGIYCLPSCPARTPNPENVVHFPDPATARAAGLRPCLRCRPDDFYRGYDPDEADAAAIAREVVSEPARFKDARALALRTGVGMTKLYGLFRACFHATPGAFLAGARVAFAAARLRQGARILDAALDAGFESQSAFYANFTARVGMTPDAYRRLPRAPSFSITLPADYRTAELFAFHGRDPDAADARVVGRTLVKAVHLCGAPAVLAMEFARGVAHCTVRGVHWSEARAFAAHEIAARLLNAASDPGDFEARAARTPLGALVARRPGLRVPRTADPFEAVVWTIAGQQVNLAFAATLRRRIIERYGKAVDGLRAHPTPRQLADANAADLRAAQWSARKAEYLVGVASACATGALSLDLDRSEPAPRIARRLRAQRGLGPWSADYTLLRGYGFLDCLPADDVGLQAALQHAFALGTRPDASAVAALLAPLAPWRSLATYHLWSSLPDLQARKRPAVSLSAKSS